jgi:hypothetical protein
MNENQPVTAGMDKVLLVTNSVVVQDNTGIRERSSGTSFCESVGRGFEPRPPHKVNTQVKREKRVSWPLFNRPNWPCCQHAVNIPPLVPTWTRRASKPAWRPAQPGPIECPTGSKHRIESTGQVTTGGHMPTVEPSNTRAILTTGSQRRDMPRCPALAPQMAAAPRTPLARVTSPRPGRRNWSPGDTFQAGAKSATQTNYGLNPWTIQNAGLVQVLMCT